MEWTEKLIETDIDRLLKYLVREKEASLKNAAEDLDVSEEILKSWVSALIDSGLVEKNYTARRGTVLKANMDSIEKGHKDVKEEAKKEIKKAHSDMESIPELEEAKSHLKKLEKVFEEEERYAERLNDILDEIEEDQEDIEDDLEKGTMSPKVLKILKKIDKSIGDHDSIQKQAEKFQKRKNRIESYIESLDRFEETMKERLKDQTKCNLCGKDFKSERGLKVHMTKIHGDEKKEEKGFFSRIKSFFSKD